MANTLDNPSPYKPLHWLQVKTRKSVAYLELCNQFYSGPIQSWRYVPRVLPSPVQWPVHDHQQLISGMSQFSWLSCVGGGVGSPAIFTIMAVANRQCRHSQFIIYTYLAIHTYYILITHNTVFYLAAVARTNPTHHNTVHQSPAGRLSIASNSIESGTKKTQW